MTQYYYIKDLELVGKTVNLIPYIFTNRKWVLDNDNLIDDRLMDYGDCSIQDIDEITPKEAKQLIGSDDKQSPGVSSKGAFGSSRQSRRTVCAACMCSSRKIYKRKIEDNRVVARCN